MIMFPRIFASIFSPYGHYALAHLTDESARGVWSLTSCELLSVAIAFITTETDAAATTAAAAYHVLREIRHVDSRARSHNAIPRDPPNSNPGVQRRWCYHICSDGSSKRGSRVLGAVRQKCPDNLVLHEDGDRVTRDAAAV